MLPRYEPVETWERRPGVACAPLGGYRRREPELTLLHQVVRERLEPFLATLIRKVARHIGRAFPACANRSPAAPCRPVDDYPNEAPLSQL